MGVLHGIIRHRPADVHDGPDLRHRLDGHAGECRLLAAYLRHGARWRTFPRPREAEMAEDPLNDGRVLNRGDKLHPHSTALGLLVDRATIQEQIYGRLGQPTANFLNLPRRFQSQNLRAEFSVDRANQVLEGAGWKRGADGLRARDGKRLEMLFKTSINAPRQKTQAIVKQAAAKAGVELELKSVLASAFFSSDAANPDTASHFLPREDG